MESFISIASLPIGKKFVDLPYRTETVEFTGSVDHYEQNDGYNTFKTAEIIISNNKGQTMISFLRFNYDLNKSDFIKALDCNFYELKK
jgi:hypothetical protein